MLSEAGNMQNSGKERENHMACSVNSSKVECTFQRRRSPLRGVVVNYNRLFAGKRRLKHCKNKHMIDLSVTSILQ
jgi:hypothetical protein